MAKNTNVNEVERVEITRAERTIGVEIELFAVEKDLLARKLKEAGLKVANIGWQGTKSFNGDWKVTTDASVTATGTGVGRGLELVSPPLNIVEMEKQLSIVCKVLNELGAKVDRTCGIHVHHHIDDLNLEQIKNIYRLYNKHQQTIDGMFPKSRRTEYQSRVSGYCQPITDRYMETIERARSIGDLQYTERYRAINFKSYVKYGTVEFRQHAGSTDFEKIFNWVLITLKLVESASTIKKVKPLSPSANPTMTMNKDFGIRKTVQGCFVRDRRKHFAKIERTA